VLSKQAAFVGSVVNKGLHAYGDKWVAIVIVIAVHMCIGQDVGIWPLTGKGEAIDSRFGGEAGTKDA
jgi:hypothetical protein